MERDLAPTELKNAFDTLLGLSTMTLATSGPDGEAHAADVYFACDEQLNLFFFSDGASQHGSDIHRDPRAAVTIHADHQGWEQIHGLQMRGECQLISSSKEWQGAWEVYLAKFPFVSEMEDLIKINQLFGFNPLWIRLVDNHQGFGFKQEWQRVAAVIGGEEVWRWELLGSQHGASRSEHG